MWNKNFAFAMAALGSPDLGEPRADPIAMTLAAGGGTVGYPQVGVGFAGDPLVYAVTTSNATQWDPMNNQFRFGDYFGLRNILGSLTPHYATEVYEVRLNPLPPGMTSGTCMTVGCTARMRYVEFGQRPIE